MTYECSFTVRFNADGINHAVARSESIREEIHAHLYADPRKMISTWMDQQTPVTSTPVQEVEDDAA